MMINVKKKLREEIDRFKQQEFTLEKFKDDNSAIQFFTGCPNHKALLAQHSMISSNQK